MFEELKELELLEIDGGLCRKCARSGSNGMWCCMGPRIVAVCFEP